LCDVHLNIQITRLNDNWEIVRLPMTA